MRVAIGLVLCGILLACSAPPDSPENQVRALVARAEQAAEARAVGALQAMLAENYIDGYGYNKRTVVNMLKLYFFRHQSVYLLVRIKSLTFPTPEQARLEVAVAMAGAPLPDGLTGVQADLVRFSIDLVKSGVHWQVEQADWDRASLADFI